ncbi:LysR family transcriptional regulator [Rhodobacteraceae bacterium RKSG542]|uniref:LysR family transcriptional regulator n=1 Tax=Pseudovibrio flavus TaxID=2529854 RepID=UPI0012BD7ACE|nr:LysR family transcriptional regulator [Pseudovibrio flavus]MTI17952.1 LysR family transcriptional regulator [Pseudovibrio flavus]
MAISVDQLRAFVAAYESGSFVGAANTLGKHLTSVSAQIGNLEIDLGFALFERSRRGVSPTRKADELYRYAEVVLKELGLFSAKAESLLEQEPTHLSIAIDVSLRSAELTRCYQDVLATFPLIKLKILNGDAAQVMEWVSSRTADIGVIISMFTAARGVAQARAFNFEICFVAPPDWQLQEAGVKPSEINSHTQIIHEFVLGTSLAEGHRISNHTLVCNNAFEIIEMVKAGVGWAITPRYMVGDAIEQGVVQEFRLAHGGKEYWYAEAIRREDIPFTDASQLFWNNVMGLADR